MREVVGINANFEGASLYRANLENSRLIGANLHDTLLESANLADARISRKSIGFRLLQENPKRYADHLHWDDPNLSADEWNRYYTHRFERIREIYGDLHSSFSRHGYREDASWAYYKERVFERKMHSPAQTRLYFGNEISAKDQNSIWHWLWFYLRHLVRWFLLWVAELSCGYGERPARTIILVVVIVPIFAYLFRLTGGISTITGESMTGFDYINYSFGSFSTVSFARFVTMNALAELLTSIEALFGIASLALLMFALGNRISR